MSFVQRFLFEDLDIQGAWARLDDVFLELVKGRNYPSNVAQILGEFCAIGALLADLTKNNARLALQLKAQAPIQSLFADFQKEEAIFLRAMAKPAEKVKDIQITAGENDCLLVNLELPDSKKPYQSQVPVDEKTVALIFQKFIAQSDQTPIFIQTLKSEDAVAALFLKKLPHADEKDKDGFLRLSTLAQTLAPKDLNKDFPALLQKLFGEDSFHLRLFAPTSISYRCPYEKEKMINVLKSLSVAELEAMFQQSPTLHVYDEICNHDYYFTREDIP